MLTSPAADTPSLREKVEPKSEAADANHQGSTVEQGESSELKQKAEIKRKLLQHATASSP